MGEHIFDKELGDLSTNDILELKKKKINIEYIRDWGLFQIEFNCFREMSIGLTNGWGKGQTLGDIIRLILKEYNNLIEISNWKS